MKLFPNFKVIVHRFTKIAFASLNKDPFFNFAKGNMGWHCGQLFEYSSWYWHDEGVAECRLEESRRVCAELFGISAETNVDSHDMSQKNSGLNLFTINAFGQEHTVSHVGFTSFLIILGIVAVLAIFVFRKFQAIKTVRRPPQWHRPGQVIIHDPARDITYALDPSQLAALQRGQTEAIRDRHFEEVDQREWGCSLPWRTRRSRTSRSAPRGEEEDEDTLTQQVRSHPISQLGGTVDSEEEQ